MTVYDYKFSISTQSELFLFYFIVEIFDDEP